MYWHQRARAGLTSLLSPRRHAESHGRGARVSWPRARLRASSPSGAAARSVDIITRDLTVLEPAGHPRRGHGGPLCGKEPPRGFSPFALQHAPPAPDQAQGGLQRRPASAKRQLCSGWPATPAAFSTQAAAAATCAAPPAAHAAEKAKEVLLTTSASGLKWGDIRPGVGNVPGPGQTVTIDYMMTKRAGAPRSTLAVAQP